MPSLTDVAMGSAKRMNASILFFDLENFTGVTSRLPNEYTLYILNLITPTVMKVLANWDGVIEKNTGDGVMALLGTKTTDQFLIARDAIESAMAIRFVMLNEIHPLLRRQELPLLNFRMGIDMGEVLLARIGIHYNSFITAVGSAANRAAKLQSLADSNGICIGDNLFQHLHPVYDDFCYEGAVPDWNWKNNDGSAYHFYHYEGHWHEPT
jgi:class 3 adenylate cyclase